MIVKTAQLDGLRLAYRDLGEGPAVLLLHGWPTSSFLWRNVMVPIARANRVVAPDLPGFGASDKPLGIRYTFDFFSRALDLLLEHLRIEEASRFKAYFPPFSPAYFPPFSPCPPSPQLAPPGARRHPSWRLSFARTPSASFGDRPGSMGKPETRETGGRVVGSRAVGLLGPSVVLRTVEDGARSEGKAERGAGSGAGARASWCWTTPPAARSDGAGPRLRGSPRSRPGPAARWAVGRACPCRARDECASGGSTRSSGSGCGAGAAR